jgi:hypothetical protein
MPKRAESVKCARRKRWLHVRSREHDRINCELRPKAVPGHVLRWSAGAVPPDTKYGGASVKCHVTENRTENPGAPGLRNAALDSGATP